MESMAYLFDETHLFERVDFIREVLGDEGAGFDLYIGGDGVAGNPLSALAEPVGFGAAAMVSWRGTDPVGARLHRHDQAGGWGVLGAAMATGFDGRSVEISLPLATILDRGVTRARLPFRLTDRTVGAERDSLLHAGPGYFQLPDPAWGISTP